MDAKRKAAPSGNGDPHSFDLQNKDKHLSQLRQVNDAFKMRPMTMLECSRITGIERAGVCWYVRDLREGDRIRMHHYGLCPITKFRAGFLTTDQALFPEQPTDQTLFDREPSMNSIQPASSDMNPRDYYEIKVLLVEIRDKVTVLAAAQKEMLTPVEVCKWLKIGRSTYQRYVERGIFEQVRIDKEANGKVYVQRSEIERLIDEGKL